MPDIDSSGPDAIVIRDLHKHFKKRTITREYSTLKTELIRWLRREPKRAEPSRHIQALRGVNLTIPKGKTVGMIGRNGSGKSTLLKLITGIYTPTSGVLQVNGRISALLELGAGFHPDFSGRENIFINGIILGLSRAEIKERLDEIIAFSELGEFIDEPVRTYSSGMFMRLAFSVATHVNPDILLIDEILAVGDEHFSKKSLAKMTEFKERGKTIVYVTHDLGTVQRWCDLAAWVDGGTIRAVGPPDYVISLYRQEVARAELLQNAQAQAAQTTSVQVPAASTPESLAAAQPSFGPKVSADRRWGNFKMELEGVRLLDAQGQPVTVLDAEDALDVCIDFRAKEALGDVSFSLGFFREDGSKVYGTTSGLEHVELPKPLPESGTLRFRVSRLGLLDGNYSLDVAVQTKDGVDYDVHKRLYSFSVRAKLRDSGQVRPSHTWVLEPAASPVVQKATG